MKKNNKNKYKKPTFQVDIELKMRTWDPYELCKLGTLVDLF